MPAASSITARRARPRSSGAARGPAERSPSAPASAIGARMTIVTRFAPSPTGRLHVGNIRTALHNWMLAKQAG
ncbi:MAG TPA: hypothetical protein DCQ48_04450, partial [Erythrobacter sp.]|nr:hypothetical protein [Erythrobacter sp.]